MPLAMKTTTRHQVP